MEKGKGALKNRDFRGRGGAFGGKMSFLRFGRGKGGF